MQKLSWVEMNSVEVGSSRADEYSNNALLLMVTSPTNVTVRDVAVVVVVVTSELSELLPDVCVTTIGTTMATAMMRRRAIARTVINNRLLDRVEVASCACLRVSKYTGAPWRPYGLYLNTTQSIWASPRSVYVLNNILFTNHAVSRTWIMWLYLILLLLWNLSKGTRDVPTKWLKRIWFTV